MTTTKGQTMNKSKAQLEAQVKDLEHDIQELIKALKEISNHTVGVSYRNDDSDTWAPLVMGRIRAAVSCAGWKLFTVSQDEYKVLADVKPITTP